MSIWAIAIIVITVALVVGPVAMLRPSKRDNRLSQLRAQAAQKGIRVRLATLQSLGKEQSLAVYSLSCQKPEQPHPQWQLIKQGFSHDLHFYGQWDWADAKQVAAVGQQDVLLKQLESLDESILALEVTEHSVAIYWQERKLSVDDIHQMLEEMQARFIR